MSFCKTDVTNLVSINITLVSSRSALLVPHMAVQYCSNPLPLNMVIVMGHNHTNSTHQLTAKNFLLLQNFTAGAVYNYILKDNHSSVVYTSGEFSMPVDYTGKEKCRKVHLLLLIFLWLSL